MAAWVKKLIGVAAEVPILPVPVIICSTRLAAPDTDAVPVSVILPDPPAVKFMAVALISPRLAPIVSAALVPEVRVIVPPVIKPLVVRLPVDVTWNVLLLPALDAPIVTGPVLLMNTLPPVEANKVVAWVCKGLPLAIPILPLPRVVFVKVTVVPITLAPALLTMAPVPAVLRTVPPPVFPTAAPNERLAPLAAARVTDIAETGEDELTLRAPPDVKLTVPAVTAPFTLSVCTPVAEAEGATTN